MSNPIPSNLRSEAKKAAKILRDFTEISNRNGPDKLIPAHVIAKAEGLAIISVIKAGFMITARGGSGIVIARLADRRWSAPSAIGIAGLGGGFEIGVEVSDLVIILNQRRAIEAFTKGGNLTLGGNCTVAVGPMGRNVEADVALRSPAAVFTYCRSRGLFAGISLEGSYLIERKETNRKWRSVCGRSQRAAGRHGDPPVHRSAARRPELRPRRPHHRHHQDGVAVRLVGGANGRRARRHLSRQLRLVLTGRAERRRPPVIDGGTAELRQSVR
ncbi:SH3 domain-containing YSC84-like protein 1 isoform 2-T2 [Symphorus nematophorus]